MIHSVLLLVTWYFFLLVSTQQLSSITLSWVSVIKQLICHHLRYMKIIDIDMKAWISVTCWICELIKCWFEAVRRKLKRPIEEFELLYFSFLWNANDVKWYKLADWSPTVKLCVNYFVSSYNNSRTVQWKWVKRRFIPFLFCPWW